MELSIQDLSKKYNRKKFGIRSFDMDFKPGIYGLLGPNGAGKSTLLKIIATLVKPTSGFVEYNNIDIGKSPNTLRRVLGYLPQEFGVYPSLNAYEFLRYVAALKGVGGNALDDRIYQLLEGLNLLEVAKNPLKSYSGGMIQRIGIAQSLLNDPEILILDEPLVGLDPEERLRFKDLISELATDKIIIISSHIVTDIESIADFVVVMKKGGLIAKGTQEAIIEKVSGLVFEKIIPKQDLDDFKKRYLIISTYRFGDNYKIRFIDPEKRYLDSQTGERLEDALLQLINMDGHD